MNHKIVSIPALAAVLPMLRWFERGGLSMEEIEGLLKELRGVMEWSGEAMFDVICAALPKATPDEIVRHFALIAHEFRHPPLRERIFGVLLPLLVFYKKRHKPLAKAVGLVIRLHTERGITREVTFWEKIPDILFPLRKIGLTDDEAADILAEFLELDCDDRLMRALRLLHKQGRPHGNNVRFLIQLNQVGGFDTGSQRKALNRDLKKGMDPDDIRWVLPYANIVNIPEAARRLPDVDITALLAEPIPDWAAGRNRDEVKRTTQIARRAGIAAPALRIIIKIIGAGGQAGLSVRDCYDILAALCKQPWVEITFWDEMRSLKTIIDNCAAVCQNPAVIKEMLIGLANDGNATRTAIIALAPDALRLGLSAEIFSNIYYRILRLYYNEPVTPTSLNKRARTISVMLKRLADAQFDGPRIIRLVAAAADAGDEAGEVFNAIVSALAEEAVQSLPPDDVVALMETFVREWPERTLRI